MTATEFTKFVLWSYEAFLSNVYTFIIYYKVFNKKMTRTNFNDCVDNVYVHE